MRLEGRYPGKSEWLVYGAVEKDAVVAEFRISDLLESPICTPDFRSALRLDAIQQASNMSELYEDWEKDPPDMTYETGEVIAM